MAQKVTEIVEEEIIDENTVKKEVEEAKKEFEKGQAEAVEEEKTEEEKAADKRKAARAAKKAHSKRYHTEYAKIDHNQIYPIEEAIEKVLETSKVKFDATIEAHIRLSIGNIRSTITLPSGAAKEKKVAIVDDKNVEAFVAEVKTGKIDFDVLISTPSAMPKLAQLAKVLGPKGLMPNPKAGTVVEDTKTAAEEIKSGKVEYRQDGNKIIHIAIAKVSFGAEKIKANLEALIKALPKNKLVAIYLTSTMGPSVKVELPK